MSRRGEPIECENCGEVCGYMVSSKDEPDYAEGFGENYADENGNWFCSEECQKEFKFNNLKKDYLDTIKDCCSPNDSRETAEAAVRDNWSEVDEEVLKDALNEFKKEV